MLPIVVYSAVIIEIVILFFSPFRKQSAPILFLGLLGFLFAFVPVTTSDNWVYHWYYVNPEISTKFEPLFNWLMHLFYYGGLDYTQFKIVIFMMEMLLIFWGLNIMKIENKRIVYLFYTLIHFFESGIQLRNYLMATIVFVALAYLWRSNKYDNIRFLVLIVIAILIQSAAAFFIVMLPMKRLNTKKKQLWFISIVSLLSLFIAIPATRSVYIAIVTGVAGKIPVVGTKILQYALRFEPGQIILIDVLLTILLYSFFSLIIKKLNEKKEYMKYAIFGQQLSLFLFILFPLYLVAYNFDRILIDSMIMFFAIFGKFFNNEIGKTNKFVILFVAVGLFGTYSYSTYHYGIKYSSTYEPVLYQNTIYPDLNHVMKGDISNE